MKTKHLFPCLTLTAVCFLAGAAYAQEDGNVDGIPTGILNGIPNGVPNGIPNGGNNGATNGAAVVGANVYVAEENTLGRLPAVLGRGGGPGAVSLRASAEAFDADPAARDALLAWVRRGGVVFLHTGAARAFGFVTVEARPGSNQLAGQFFGRARAALPFGSHPLLMDSASDALGAANGGANGAPAAARSNVDETLLPGVNVVFYEMQPGDHLVESHPAGTPLLEVSDLAANGGTPLYASAIAPFGAGLAVFTPDSIDQNHGDGALFARNLLTLMSSGRGGRGPSPLVSVSAKAIENGAPAELRQALDKALRIPAAPALPAIGTTDGTAADGTNSNRAKTAAQLAEEAAARRNRLNGVAPIIRNPVAPPVAPPVAVVPATPADDVTGADPEQAALLARDESGVLISRAEATTYAALLQGGGQRAEAAINLLQARLFVSRGDAPAATRALDATEGLVPGSAEVSLWRGLILAGAAQEINQPSPVRATQLNDAARQLAAAAQGASFLATPGGNVGGIPIATISGLSERLGLIAQVFSLEPPLVQQFGQGDAAITVRAIEGDPALRLVIPGATALASARNFGWRGDREEILLFPTPETFGAYRQALGLTGPTIPLPSGAVGDVVGQRLLMLALPSVPIVQRTPGAAGGVRVVSTGSAVAGVLARLHSYVLLNALDEGGTNVPAWMQLGVENLVNSVIIGDPQLGLGGQGLAQIAQAGGLLTPQQFNGALANAGQTGMNNNIAQAQAASIVAYLYGQYGAGAVVETLQRLGTGQSIDEALQATTQGDEMALFESWRLNQFGPANLPNG